MPAKTHGEKIDELIQLTTGLGKSVGIFEETIKGIQQDISASKDRLHPLETRVAILETHVQMLTEDKKEWARRL